MRRGESDDKDERPHVVGFFSLRYSANSLRTVATSGVLGNVTSYQKH